MKMGPTSFVRSFVRLVECFLWIRVVVVVRSHRSFIVRCPNFRRCFVVEGRSLSAEHFSQKGDAEKGGGGRWHDQMDDKT